MNKVERARQLAKQTAEQEQCLEKHNRLFQQYIFQKLEFQSQKSGTILKNQEELKDSLKSQMGLLAQVKQEISELMKEQQEMKKAQKRIQAIWIITFLTIAIPILAFWVAWLAYWIL